MQHVYILTNPEFDKAKKKKKKLGKERGQFSKVFLLDTTKRTVVQKLLKIADDTHTQITST